MSGFEHVDTAAAMRDIINNAAKKVVNNLAPGPNIGRVISVNLASLTATVWFPGDDAPITVNLFSNTLPQLWHDQFDDGTGTVINTSTTGYGSMVAVETINGKQYITEVLSGGQFGFDQRALDLSIVNQEATDIAQSSPKDLIGTPAETWINCHVTSSTVTNGQAINFGPFLTFDGKTPIEGAFDMSVTVPNGACKQYTFITSPPEDFDHPGSNGILDSWMRIMPERQATTLSTVSYDFDLDVCVKKTLYGNIDDFTSGYEVWFRIVRRDVITAAGLSNNPNNGLDAYVALRSTSIQRGRSVTGRQLFMQEVVVSPPSFHGYLGWHNSRALWWDTDADSVYDDFGRSTPVVPKITDSFNRFISSSWGVATSGQTWTVAGGAAADYGVSLGRATMSLTSTNVERVATLSNIGPDIDVTVFFSPTVVATGAQFEQKVRVRNNGTTWYETNVQYQTDGTVTLYLIRQVTTLSGIASAITYNASSVLAVRMQAIGNTIRHKIWNSTTTEPAAWTASVSDSTYAGSSTDNMMIVGNRITANTNSGLVVLVQNLSEFNPLIITPGWGLSDSSQPWVPDVGGNIYGLTGTYGTADVAANNTVYRNANSTANGPTVDITSTFWVDVMPTGASAEAWIYFRRVDNNNYYIVKCVFATAGTITASIAKDVAGVFTTIGTDVTGIVAYTPGVKIKLRAYVKGSSIRSKIWLDSALEPEAWTRIETDTSIGFASTGNGAGFFCNTGNTNSKPYRINMDKWRADLQGPTAYSDQVPWRHGPWRNGLLRIANDLQKTWQLDGVWTWTGSNLSWTGTIYFGGIGNHRNGLINGRMNLTMPAVGDLVRIAQSTGFTMTGSGIFLGGGDSLWVSIPPEGDWKDLSKYLFILRAVNVTDYILPEWAVLLAYHQPGSVGQAPSLRLGNGDFLDNWRTATLINGWTGTARYRRESSQTVRLQGQIGGGAKTGDIAFNLPVGFRPGNSVFQSTVSDGVWGFLTVATNGDVQRQAGGVTAYMALDHVTFVAEG